MQRRGLRILDDEDSDPMLSSINLVDVFLVAIAMLIIALVNHPSGAMWGDDVTVIRDAGKPTMEIMVRDGQRLEHFRSTGTSAEGNGMEAGTAYRLADGSIVYVPKTAEETGP